MQRTQPTEAQPTPAPTQPCPGPGDRTETTTVNGVTRSTWHGCTVCHGSH